MLKPTATIELVYIDETGSTSAVVVNVPASTSIATMDAQATALASLIAPMTDATLIKIRYSYRTVYQVNIADAGSNPLTVNGVFIFSDFDFNTAGLISIPGLKSSLIATDGNGAEVLIDITSDEVIDFIEQLIAMDATNPMGILLLHLEAAYRQSRV